MCRATRPLRPSVRLTRPSSYGRIRRYSRAAAAANAFAETLERRVLLSAGELDPTFGSRGIAMLDVGAVSVASIVSAPDGKIVTAASTWGRYDDRIGLARAKADGTPDGSFAGGWTPVLPPDDAGLITAESQTGLAVQPDRRVLIAGAGYDEGADDPDAGTMSVRRVTFIARLKEDGSRDPSFGGGDGVVTGAEGIVTLDSRAPFEPFKGLAVRADGKILTTRSGSLYRLNPDGTPDRSFGGDGVAALPVPPGGSFAVSDLELAADGSGDVIVAGSVAAAGVDAFAIARVRQDGTAASSFGGGDGLVLAPYDAGAPFTRAPVHLAVGPGGSIVAAGGRPDASGQSRFSVARYTAAGLVDTAFGRGGADGDGFVSIGVPGDPSQRLARDLAVMPDGRVVAVGDAGGAFNVVRLRADGSIDPTFAPGGTDGDGVATVTFLPEDTGNPDDQVSYGGAFAVLLQGDGRAVAATGKAVSDGWASSGDVVLVRFLGDDPPARPLVVNGTPGADRITVDLSDDKASLSVDVNGTVTTHALAGIGGITVSGLGGNDYLKVASGINLSSTMDGGAGNDTLVGGAGNDTLVGGDGDDVLDGRGGADLFQGGAGSDVADYSSRTASVFVGIGANSDDGAPGERDNVSGDVENVWGGRGNDVLRGSAADNRLAGGAGDDVLYGNGGRDALLGGAGDDQFFARDGDAVADTIDGGDGADRAEADPTDLVTNVEVLDQPLYEAERASIAGGVVSTAHSGYTGGGFVDFVNATGDSVEFTVQATSAGTYALSFRYANGSAADRTLALSANGQSVGAGVVFASTGSWTAWRDVTVNAPLVAGVNKVRLTATGQSGPNLDSLSPRPVPAPRPVTLQAESAALSGATVASSRAGYTGGGYADYLHAGGDFVEFTYDAPSAGNYTLDFRYANGGLTDRPLELAVNGVVARPGVPFAPTGSWSTWATASDTVSLAAGINRIRLTATGKSGPNLDALAVSFGGAAPEPIRIAGGVLTVEGGAGDDVITVMAAGGRIVATLGTQSGTFAAADVRHVELFGRGGNDSITVGAGVPAALLDGGDGGDALTGGDGNDTLRGGAGQDALNGDGGDDLLDGGAGDDRIDGGPGADMLDYSSRTNDVTVDFEEGVWQRAGFGSYEIVWIANGGEAGEFDRGLDVENVRGGAGKDRLSGSGEANALYGGPGDDTLLGGEGDDALFGEGGNDRLDGQDDDDTLDGGAGTNTLLDLPDTARVFEGRLIVIGTGAGETISVTTGASASGPTLIVHRTGRSDVAFPAGSVTSIRIEGMGGDDTLRLGNADGSAAPNLPARLVGGGGNDILVGGPADDTLSGGPGINSLDGAAGRDVLNGGGGFSTADYSRRTTGVTVVLPGVGLNEFSENNLYSSRGEDTIRFDVGAAVGGSGDDSLEGGDGTTLYGGPGDDTLRVGYVNIDVNIGNITLYGGPGNDSLYGDENADAMAFGEEGDDTFHPHEYGGLGVSGGPGTDTVTGNGFFEYGLDFDASGTSVEVIFGSDQNDVLAGSDAAETIDGGLGNDTIDGRGGDDVIDGGGGNDVLTGGAGRDQLRGGEGDDTLFSRDAIPDTLDGGPGADTARRDDLLDSAVDVETFLV